MCQQITHSMDAVKCTGRRAGGKMLVQSDLKVPHTIELNIVWWETQ